MRSALGLLGPLLLAAYSGMAQRYPVLPVPNSPHDIGVLFQDTTSRIWVGGKDDVYSFDGSQFYSLRRYGFPRETPKTIAEDSEGGIWIGTQSDGNQNHPGPSGLYRYHAGRVEKILSGDILSVVSAAPGLVLASLGKDNTADYGDIYRFQAVREAWIGSLMVPKAARQITVDHQRNVIYPCPYGYCTFSPRQLADWPQDTMPSFERGNDFNLPERVIRDRFGCLWARSETEASYRCPGDSQSRLIPSASVDGLSFLQEAADGSVLMLGPLTLGRPKSFHIATGKNGISGTNTALAARDGTIWLGEADGLYRLMYPFRLEYWTAENGVEIPYAFLHKNGSVFAASDGISVLDTHRNTWTQIIDQAHVGTVVSLLDGSNDTLYATALLRGAIQVDTNGRIVSKQSGVGGATLARDADGGIWQAGDGISQVTKRGGKLASAPARLGPDTSLNMKYDEAHKALWSCYGKGVAVMQGGTWRHLGPRDGLLDPGTDCVSVAPTANGDLWVGYGSNPRLSLIRNALRGSVSITNYAPGEDIGDGDTAFISPDSRGWVWRGSNGEHVASEAAAEAGHWIHLDEQDGLPNAVSNQNSFYSDPDGSVWFGAGASIVHFIPPNGFAADFPSPVISVAGFSVGKAEAISSEDPHGMSWGQELVTHIGCLQFDRRNAIRLRYRLLPEQRSWQSSKQFDLHLGKLHWGRHTLQVQAQLSTGPWSEVVQDSFTVLKPVWLEWPALVGYFVTSSLAFAGGRRWDRRRRARARKAFPEVSEWRLAALSPELNQTGGKLLDSRFEVGRVLARGGFATVAEGRDLKYDGRRCAIKIFRQELADKEWLTRRFQQEVLALSQIRHPNVVGIYGSGTLSGGGFYLVMEYIEGVTLRELLEAGKLTPLRTAMYLRQAGDALEEIHRHGICHRDLKPENLMIRTGGASGEELVLIDFSIAIVKDPDETLHGLSRAAGTIYYMAPEQAIGYASPATDIYSLAKIVIEMLTGQRLSVLLPDASMDLPARVREMLATLPVRLSATSIELLSAALEFDPARRPQQAEEFAEPIAEDLQRSADGG